LLNNLNITEFLKDAIIPPICSVCGKICAEFLCQDCNSRIKFLEGTVCWYCGRPITSKNNPGSEICALCKNENYSFYRLRSFSLYREPIVNLIQKFKYKKYYFLSKLLAGFLKKAYERHFSSEKIDYIDTVPNYSAAGQYIKDYKSHMQILAEDLSKIIGIPFLNNIIKIRDTSKQQKLDYYLRKINLSGAFKVRNCLLSYGKNLLLIDDVWTTGSTLNEISSILKKSKANKIYLLTLARGA
jgi:competence protein ComFC